MGNPMDTHSEHLTKVHISNALSQSRTRVAVLIVESILIGVDLIDEQSPVVVEALIEYFHKKIREEQRLPRRDLREALLKYTEGALTEARMRERRLLQGIAGREPDADATSESCARP
jgi:hypothetical protein